MERAASWVTIKCKKDETLVTGSHFKTAGLAGDPEWDVIIHFAECVDSFGNVTQRQQKINK